MNREALSELCYVTGKGGKLRHRVPGLKGLEKFLRGPLKVGEEELPWFEGQIRAKRATHIERLAAKGRAYA